MKTWLAAVLAVAIAAVPLVLDQCAAMCEAHNQRAIATTAASCHHASATATPTSTAGPHLVGQPEGSCGHDHDTVSTLESGAIRLSRTPYVSVAILPTAAGTFVAAPSMFERSHAPPGSSVFAGSQSLPLRI